VDDLTARRMRTYVEVALELEAESGWTRMWRVPSTQTWKTLDYISALPAERRAHLFEALVANAMYFFEPGRDRGLQAYPSGHVEYRAMVDSQPRTGGWDYLDVRTLRAILADRRSPTPSPELGAVPAAVLARAAAIQPTTPTQIRNVVKETFAQRFGARAENRKGGNWRYAGAHHGRPLTVAIDYGGMSDQLRYQVSFDEGAKGIHVRGISYERMLGVGLGHWDSLTADNLAASVALLADLVADLATIPDRV
jgi:hypothetical protein